MGEHNDPSEEDRPRDSDSQAVAGDIAEWAVDDWRPERSFEEIEELMEGVRDEGINSEAGARKAVRLLRETMEYVETFGIRLLAEFEGEDQISSRLTTYEPDEVRTIYKHIATENANSFCESYDEISGSYTENLLLAFGLPEEITRYDAFSVLKGHLSRIAQYYTNYYDIYNAAKHARRYDVVELEEFETDAPIQLEEETKYVLFVPKSAGEAASTVVSAQLLANYSFGVAKRVRALSETIEREESGDEEGEPDLTLIQDDLESILNEYGEVRRSESGTPFVLYGNFSKEEEFNRIFRRLAVIEYRNGELQFHIVDDSDYGPFTVHFDGASRVMGTTEQTVTIDRFEVTGQLTINQYEELWKLHSAMEKGDVESIGLYFSGKKAGKGLEYASLDDWLPPDEAGRFLHAALVEQKHIDLLKAINQMYDTEIPAPTRLPEEDLQSLDNCLDGRTTSELTGEEIRDLAEQLFEL